MAVSFAKISVRRVALYQYSCGAIPARNDLLEWIRDTSRIRSDKGQTTHNWTGERNIDGNTEASGVRSLALT